MSIGFASKISALRREKNVSQKLAAEELGISQALLSHYEKGIRECNLEFVKKAAAYYNVSSDYLLGISDTKHGNSDVFEDSDIPSDTQMQTTTVLRAFVALMNMAEEEGGEAEKNFNSFFAVSIKKFIERSAKDKKNYSALCDIAVNSLPKIKTENSILHQKYRPQSIKTVESYASELINTTVTKVLTEK